MYLYQLDDGFFNWLKWTKKKTYRRLDLRAFVRRASIIPTKPALKSEKFFCLFQAVEEPIILLIFEDAATLQLGYLGLIYCYVFYFNTLVYCLRFFRSSLMLLSSSSPYFYLVRFGNLGFSIQQFQKGLRRTRACTP